MHRLHVKIFLWFWVGVVVVSGTLVTLTELTHSRAEDDRQWREKYGPRVDLWARQETHIFRTQGSSALQTYVGSFQSDPGVHNYIFDADGHELLGRQADAPVLHIVGSMGRSPGWTQVVDARERIIAEKIIDALDDPYVVVVDYPGPSILARSLFEFLSADLSGGGLNRTALVRLAAVLMVAGLFCFVLARHIAGPIDRLRSATRRIANEQLQARVDQTVLNRHDELAALGRDFNCMAERIEHLVTAQRHLLSDVSHALRSPLARLNVALGLARRNSAPAASEHLDRIERETERLNTLIGQLLTMARVDSGVDLEHRTVFDLGSVVDEVAIDADYEARDRHCAVRFSERRECLVEGARDMLRSAVENVVRNAVRHATDGTSVEISMDCRHVRGATRAVIQIRDHGPGVPEKAVDSLFLPFYRGTNGKSESPNGTGLGLAITRRIFEIHGGTATAANAAGGGLIVILDLPTRTAVGGETSRAGRDTQFESGARAIYGIDVLRAGNDTNS
jgi:two-component system sensor histidine kinase CpxA